MTTRLRLAALVIASALIGSVLCTVAFAWHQGDRVYIVHTGSMIPTYEPGDVVVDRPASTGYVVGDPITFEVSPGVLVTHRLASIDKRGQLHTKGDGNRTRDAWTLQPQNVRGVVFNDIAYLGYAMVFLKQRTGVLGLMTSALALILLWGLCFPAAVAEGGEVAGASGVRVPRQRSAGDPAGILAGRGKVRTWNVRRSRDTADDGARKDVHAD